MSPVVPHRLASDVVYAWGDEGRIWLFLLINLVGGDRFDGVWVSNATNKKASISAGRVMGISTG